MSVLLLAARRALAAIGCGLCLLVGLSVFAQPAPQPAPTAPPPEQGPPGSSTQPASPSPTFARDLLRGVFGQSASDESRQTLEEVRQSLRKAQAAQVAAERAAAAAVNSAIEAPGVRDVTSPEARREAFLSGVRSASSGLTRGAGPGASRELRRFLTRKDPGFNLQTFSVFARDLEDFTGGIRARLSGLRASTGTFEGLLLQSIPIQLLVLLIGVLWWVDRRARHLRQTIWELLPTITHPTIDHTLDSSLRVLARTIPIMIVLLPVYVPLQGLFPEATWLAVIKEVLWILLTYRMLKVVGNELLVGEMINLPQKPLGLKRWFEVGLKIGMSLWMAAQLVRILGYDPEVYALLGFCLKVFIALHGLRLLVLRDELTLFFPEASDSQIYRIIRANLQVLLRIIVGLSFSMMILWALGFENAATLILWRAYALIGLILASSVVYQRINRYLRWLIRSQETPDGEPVDRERHQVLTSLESSVFTLGVWGAVWLVLKLVGLWPVLVSITSYPLVEPGNLQISFYVVGRGLLYLLIFIFGSRLARAVLNERIYPRFEVDVGVGYAVNTMVHYFMFFVGLMLAFSSLGVDMTAVGIFFSALGIGIGIGLQGIVNNLLSGFILLFGRSVKKGDYITINDRYGRVDAVGARSVTITTPDNFEMIIPSSDLVSNSIINWTLTSPLIRVKIPVGVSYDSDVPRVKETLLSAAYRHPKILRRPTPEVWITGFGDSSVDFALLVYIDCRSTNQTRVTGELNYHIWDALLEAGIEIPFPQRDLHIRSGIDALQATRDAPNTGLADDASDNRREDHAEEDVHGGPARGAHAGGEL